MGEAFFICVGRQIATAKHVLQGSLTVCKSKGHLVMGSFPSESKQERRRRMKTNRMKVGLMTIGFSLAKRNIYLHFVAFNKRDDIFDFLEGRTVILSVGERHP